MSVAIAFLLGVVVTLFCVLISAHAFLLYLRTEVEKVLEKHTQVHNMLRKAQVDFEASLQLKHEASMLWSQIVNKTGEPK